MLAGSAHVTNVGAYRTAFASGVRYAHYKYSGCRMSGGILSAVYVHHTNPGKSFAVDVKFENLYRPEKVRAQVHSKYASMSRSSVRTPSAVQLVRVPAPVAAQPASAAAVTVQPAPFVAPVAARPAPAASAAAQPPSATRERKRKLSMLQDDLQDGLIDKDTYSALVEKQYMSSK